MSVINQMLRDLDARGQGDAASRRAALAAVGDTGVARSHKPASSRLWWVVAALAAVGDTGVARSHKPASSRLWWVVAALAVVLAALIVSVSMGRWRAIDAVSPAPEPLPAPSASPSASEPGAIEPEPAAPLATAEAPAAVPTPAEPAPEPRLAATPAAPAAPALAAAPAPTRPATPAPAPAAPMSRASIERIAPSEDPLAEARTALADGRPDDALAALAAQPHASAERDALEAAALQQLGRHAESGQAYRRALAQEPDIGAWWAGLGISLDAEGRGAEALDAFREAQRRGPLDPALADYLGERVEALSAGEPSR